MSDQMNYNIHEESVEITGLESMQQFVGFQEDNAESFFEGLCLAEDLLTSGGTVLFKGGTEVSYERMERLAKVHKLNPELELIFRIERDEKFMEHLRLFITGRITDSLDRYLKNKTYRDFFTAVNANFERLKDKITADENFVITIYKTWATAECNGKDSTELVEHSIGTALFSWAIILSQIQENKLEIDDNGLVELLVAGLLVNYGALDRIQMILDSSTEKREKLYWEANKLGAYSHAIVSQKSNVTGTIRSVCDYNSGDRDVLQKNDRLSVMANIILVAEIYSQKTKGLFDDSVSPKSAVDYLNVCAFNKEINSDPVAALTLGLYLGDIFDFYRELEKLQGECRYSAGYPYPLVGFKSPTIFICKDTNDDCSHQEKTVKAVNLVKRFGELRPGAYFRCSLLTPKLKQFYDTHYKEIKHVHNDNNQVA